ncbi:MAG: GTP cyclohydrolase FolE2 [bacterium]
MVDVQNMYDRRKIDIDKVGIKNIKYPVALRDKDHEIQHTVADINMYVSLPKRFKGTHMSRFVEVLNRYQLEIDISNLKEILQYIKDKFKSKEAHLEMRFPYFISKRAPVSKAQGLLEYKCHFKALLGRTNNFDQVFGVEVPVTALCPCSKAISRFGAHNQRGMVNVSLRAESFIWIEDIINVVEKCASSQIYSLLKREDERYVTEQAYKNPVFVEDIVRKVTRKLSKDSRITWFTVESENLESIHNHNAYAYIERRRK